MKTLFRSLLIIFLFVALVFAYWAYKIDKPMPITSSTTFIDLFNHVGSPTKIEQYDNGTRMIQYEVVEDQVFKIINEGYPKKIKIYKFYTLTFYFDANDNITGSKIIENPDSPLLEIGKK
jgi:hypothetical protein